MRQYLPWLAYLVMAMCMMASVASYFAPGDYIIWSVMFGLLAFVLLFWLIYDPVIKAIRSGFH